MADPTRGTGKRRTTATAIGFVAVTILFFVIFMFGYGFGPGATPEGDEVAEEAPTSDQPVDAFDATDDGAVEEAQTTPGTPGTDAPGGTATGGTAGGAPANN